MGRAVRSRWSTRTARLSTRVLNGKWSVVFFGYTFCPDYCPTTLTTLGKEMDDLGPKVRTCRWCS